MREELVAAGRHMIIISLLYLSLSLSLNGCSVNHFKPHQHQLTEIVFRSPGGQHYMARKNLCWNSTGLHQTY